MFEHEEPPHKRVHLISRTMSRRAVELELESL